MYVLIIFLKTFCDKDLS